MSSWATFTTSFTSSSFPLSSPPTPSRTYTHNAYHQPGRPELLPQRRYPQAGAQGSHRQQNTTSAQDYHLLQKLVELRESKLADCSYLTRQRKKPDGAIGTITKQASVSKRAPAQLKPGPPVNLASEGVTRPSEAVTQRECKVATYPKGLEVGTGFTVQGETPARFSASYTLQPFESSWGTHLVAGTLDGSSFGGNDCFSGFPVTEVAGYSSDGSTTTSGSDAPSWSFPISREERRRGINCSDYSFDKTGRLEGLENSPVAIILTPPSAPAPKWRPCPNDPAYRPRSRTLLHPTWRAKH